MTDHRFNFSSQIVEEEEDIFYDDDVDELELIQSLQEADQQQEDTMLIDQEGTGADQLVSKENSSNNDQSFKNLLAGPSTHKAGLNKVDKEKVNEIIYEASKGSAFFERERKRDEAVTQRIDAILAKYEYIKTQDLSFEKRIIDNMIQDLEQTRDLSQCICHIDMDAFYAAVEELENPELKEVPMAVGGMSMLCTSNYLARQYGVRSAMPGFIAVKLCPQLKIIPLHFPKYRAASEKVRDVFRRYDPNFVPMSLDEAYLNLTEYLKTTDLTPSQLVERIRNEIFEETKLTASAGIACNKTLAKVCSDINKPNGQYYLPIDRASIVEFVKTLRVRQIPGVGRVTERVLEALGVIKLADIYTHRAILYKLLSPITFQFLLRNYLGIGSTTFNADAERKSMSVERTFSAMSDPNALFQKVKELSLMLEQDLEKGGYMGRTVGIKLKSVTYEVKIRSKTFPSYIWQARDIERIAKDLLIKELPVNIRLMGIKISSMKHRGSEDKTLTKYFVKKDASSSSLSSSSSVNNKEALNFAKPMTVPVNESASKYIGEKVSKKLNTNMTTNSTNDTPQNFAPTTSDDMIKAAGTETLEEAHLSLPPPVICPICNRQLALDNIQFNNHVDECLNKVEVKAILKHQIEKEKKETAVRPLQQLALSAKRRRSNTGSSIPKTKRSNSSGKSLFDYYSTS